MLEIERVKADEGRRLRSGTGRVRTRVRVCDGRRQGADEGKSACNTCTCSGNGTQEQAVQDLLCLVDLYLVYLI